MRVLLPASLLAIAGALGGCGGAAGLEATSGRTDSATRLTIVAVNPHVGRAVFELSCEPAGGDMERPARACAALEATPELVTDPEPFTCAGGLFSWWDLTISGRLHGRPVHAHTSSCWTPQMRLIGELGIARSLDAHLVPRRRETLIGGEERTVPPGVLRPGDLVVCDIDGRHLEQGVPIEPDLASETGHEGVGVTSVALTVTLHADGSVTARCT